VNHNLPLELESLRGFLPELVAEAEKKVPYASALVTQSAGETVVKSPADERTNPVPPQPGIRISVWDGATFHSVATSRIEDRDYLRRLTRELVETITVKDGPMPEPGPQMDKHFQSEFKEDPEQVTTQQRQDICRHAFDLLKDFDARIVAPRVICGYGREYRLFCNRGRLLSSDISNVGFYLVPIASDGGKQVMNFAGFNGTGHEATRVYDEKIREVADLTVRYLSADKITPGEYRVILDPDITGTLAHESFGHGCEMDALMRGAARAALYVGRRVGSDLVNIVDFGGLPGRHGSIFFSDDGVLAEEPAVLVKDGILQPTLMTDLYSFLHMRYRLPGLKLSANGRLEAYDHPIYARMTNTYFLPLPRDKGGMTKVELADPKLIDASRPELLARVQQFSDEVLKATAAESGVDVSNLEVFIRRSRTRLETGTGTRVDCDATRADAEICFIARFEDKVAEHTARPHARRFEDLDPGQLVAVNAAHARGIVRAGPPPQFQGPVVLTGEAAHDFMILESEPLSWHCAARAVYEKMSRYAKGKPVWGDKPLQGDAVTLFSDPLVPFGPNSRIEADAAPTRKVALLKEGCYDDLIGGNRYYHYLGLLEQGIKPPGLPGNTVVLAGKAHAADLLGTERVVVVKAFSDFRADPTSGDFASEIRLGEVRENGTATPFKGGLLIGNWFDAMAEVRLSFETIALDGYYGPSTIRLGSLQVAG